MDRIYSDIDPDMLCSWVMKRIEYLSIKGNTEREAGQLTAYNELMDMVLAGKFDKPKPF